MKMCVMACLILSLFFGCEQAPSSFHSDDFEELTGKKLSSWQYVQTKEDVDHLQLFKAIYDLQKHHLATPDTKERIPRVIHYIWLGPNPFPRESIENVRTWMAKHPDWTFYFWTDRDRPLPLPGMHMRKVQDLPFLALKECFKKSDNFGEKSDVLRYEILYQEGGVYVDHDVKCLQSFDLLNRSYDFYCGIDMPYTSALPTCVFTTNNLIAVKPQHPILARCLQSVADNWDRLQRDYPGEDIDSMLSRVLHRTFWLFGQAVKEKNNQEGTRDIVFPAYYFDAPNEKLALFARHQYAGSWHQKESEFETMVRKRLMTITKKCNLLFLALGASVLVNIAGFTFLILRAQRKSVETPKPFSYRL